MPNQTGQAIPLPDIDDESATREFLKRFDPGQDRNEAFVLVAWLYTDNFKHLIQEVACPTVMRGSNPPDFLLTASGLIAVEVTRFVTPTKAIYDKIDYPPDAYISTLRNNKPTAAFHIALKAHALPDSSDVAPHVEAVADLDRDYYHVAETVLRDKAEAARHYSPLYNRTIILVDDRLSESVTLQNRLPRLRQLFQSMTSSASIEGVVMNTGRLWAGIAYSL